MTTGLVLGLLTALGLAMTVTPEALIRLFNAEAEVVTHGAAMLRIVGMTVGFQGAFFVLGGIYRALEKTVPYFVWTFVACWVLRIPMVYLLSLPLGVNGIWTGMAAANMLAFAGAALHLRMRYMPQLGEITPAATRP